MTFPSPDSPHSSQNSHRRRTAQREEDVARLSVNMASIDPASDEGEERMASQHEQLWPAPG